MKKIVSSFCSKHGRRVGGTRKGYLAYRRRSVYQIKTCETEGNSFDSLFRTNNGEIDGMNLFSILFRHCFPVASFQCQNNICMYDIGHASYILNIHIGYNVFKINLFKKALQIIVHWL